jgi:DNA-directed RNA polymerase subunit RPC12/RpoP
MSVVYLSDRRKERTKQKSPEYVYFCLKCDGGLFQIAASGYVVCANPMCGAKMGNLFVHGPAPAA